MNAYAKIGVAVAAVLIVAVVGYNLLPAGPSNIGGPAATPIPTVTPTPLASSAGAASPSKFPCDDPAVYCAGDLAAGVHTSSAFRPKLTYQVPAGWQNTLDKERTYSFHPPENNFFLQVLSHLAIPEQNASCTAQRKVGAGKTVADWSKFLTTHPGLAASTPVPATVGDYVGVSITVQVNSAWKATCPNSIGSAVVILTDSDEPPSRVVWIDDQQATITILDVAGETVMVRLESGPGAAAVGRDRTTVQPIVDSFRFTPGN